MRNIKNVFRKINDVAVKRKEIREDVVTCNDRTFYFIIFFFFFFTKHNQSLIAGNDRLIELHGLSLSLLLPHVPGFNVIIKQLIALTIYSVRQITRRFYINRTMHNIIKFRLGNAFVLHYCIQRRSAE